MKVFIAWSGDQSKQIAEAIHWWLPHVLSFAQPYFSPVSIGKIWNVEISRELGQSKIGIIAMTAEGLTSPWIMFEAGAIARVIEQGGLVCPILFNIKTTELVGPLSHFNSIEFKQKEVRELVAAINKAVPEEAREPSFVDEAFNKWWPDLEQKVQAILAAARLPSVPARTDRDLLEDAVENTRAILREFEKLPVLGPPMSIPTEIYDAATQRRYGVGGFGEGSYGGQKAPGRGGVVDPASGAGSQRGDVGGHGASGTTHIETIVKSNE